MRISVIVPCFNGKKFIQEAVESLLAQTFRTWNMLQIIVVCDDDSESFEILRQFEGDICAIQLQENVGTYRSINTGIQFVSERSSVIGTMGADDRLSPFCLDRISSMFDSDELHAYSVYFKEIDERGRPIKIVNRHAPTGQFFYDRRVIEKLGGFRNWLCAADTEFWERAKAVGASLKVYRDHLFEYRRHPGQITASKDKGFGTDYRNSKVEHIKRVKYDHSLAGYVKPRVGKIAEVFGKFSDQQLEAVASQYDG